MKKAVVVFILVVMSNVCAQNRVMLREVNIETEFYDVLNKTRAEFILINETGRNNLKGHIHFNINKSSIITDMWLAIDGELQRAETLSRQTGQRIYNRITRQRIDPALLTKGANGSYFLRVFPVNKNETRRVIIEYYSILETDDSYFPVWIFNTRDTKVNITIKGSFPESSHVYINGENINLHTKNNFSLTSPTRNQFSLFKEKKPVRFYNEKYTLWQAKEKPNELNKIKKSRDIPSYLESIIENIKNKANICIERGTENKFLYSFIGYLIKKYNTKIFYDEAWNWVHIRGQYMYIDKNFSLCTQIPLDADCVDMYCPYLNIFFDYISTLNDGIDKQKTSGFLTLDLSKIVLEENERALQIRESELKLEEKSNIQNNGPGMDLQTQPWPYDSSIELIDHVFIPYDSAPQPVGGFGAIQKNLIYPDFAIRQELQGRVVVNLLIDENGKIVSTQILKSLHPVLNFLAIEAIKNVKWKPAIQRDKPVKVWINIPVVFKNDYLDKEQIEPGNSKVKKIQSRVLNRDFDIELTEQIFFYENGFDRSNNKKLKVNSEPFFDFLFDFPELIEIVYGIIYVYKADGLGLLYNGKSIYFENE